MALMKWFLKPILSRLELIGRRLSRRWRRPADPVGTCHDPLDHPAIQKMSMREQADLPPPVPCRDNPLCWR
jgi:hypothetical protein